MPKTVSPKQAARISAKLRDAFNSLHEAKVGKDEKKIAKMESQIADLMKQLPTPKGAGRRWR